MKGAKRCRISFTVSREEHRFLLAYVSRKRRWRTIGDMARDAVAQLMARNPVYDADKHKKEEV